jgi:hypothetical protein
MEDDEWWIGKNVEGSGHGFLKVLFQHPPEGTE